MPKPISFRDRPEYSQSYRKVRRSFEMTRLPTIVCRLPVTSERSPFVSSSIFSIVKNCEIEDPRCSFTILSRSALTLPWEAGAVIRSEEHTSELQSLMRILYADFCLKQYKTRQQ